MSSALSSASNDTNGNHDSPSPIRGASKKAKIATSLKLETPEPSKLDSNEIDQAILSCVDILFKEADKDVVTRKDIYFNAQEILQIKIKGERRALIKARLMELIDAFDFDDEARVAVGVEAHL